MSRIGALSLLQYLCSTPGQGRIVSSVLGRWDAGMRDFLFDRLSRQDAVAHLATGLRPCRAVHVKGRNLSAALEQMQDGRPRQRSEALYGTPSGVQLLSPPACHMHQCPAYNRHPMDGRKWVGPASSRLSIMSEMQAPLLLEELTSNDLGTGSGGFLVCFSLAGLGTRQDLRG
jgi:hypothetical protein